MNELSPHKETLPSNCKYKIIVISCESSFSSGTLWITDHISNGLCLACTITQASVIYSYITSVINYSLKIKLELYDYLSIKLIIIIWSKKGGQRYSQKFQGGGKVSERIVRP